MVVELKLHDCVSGGVKQDFVLTTAVEVWHLWPVGFKGVADFKLKTALAVGLRHLLSRLAPLRSLCLAAEAAVVVVVLVALFKVVLAVFALRPMLNCVLFGGGEVVVYSRTCVSGVFFIFFKSYLLQDLRQFVCAVAKFLDVYLGFYAFHGAVFFVLFVSPLTVCFFVLFRKMITKFKIKNTGYIIKQYTKSFIRPTLIGNYFVF